MGQLHIQQPHWSSIPYTKRSIESIEKNIDENLQGPMDNFVKRYFGHFISSRQGHKLEVSSSIHTSTRCSVPSFCPEDFLPWFLNFLSNGIDDARGLWHTSNTGVSEDSVRDTGTRIVFAAPPPLPEDDTEWGDVEVIGQIYQSRGIPYKDGLLQLCWSAHQVFGSQPMRRFLHGIYVRGTLAEFWMFDRSGLYCSDVFDIRKDFIQFLTIILGYEVMTPEELGQNKIEKDTAGQYVLTTNSSLRPEKLYIGNASIAASKQIVGSGLVCFPAKKQLHRNWTHVVKFKWCWAQDRAGDEIPRLAIQRGVWGAVSLDHYEELESTADLRSGFRWTRKNRRLLGSSKAILEPDDNYLDGQIDYTEETQSGFSNYILTCSVTSPLGRSLKTWKNTLELLQVLRDAIKCHKSLLYDAKILHQDISATNIIILDPELSGRMDQKGLLIDLDIAVQLHEQSSDRTSIGGTQLFMAISLMQGQMHTYRHDLESFLYLLLYIVISNHEKYPKETSKLNSWDDENVDFEDLAEIKIMDMQTSNFDRILDEFPPDLRQLKTLARNLHALLFPVRDGKLWTGTDEGETARDKLYDGMLREFEKAIGVITNEKNSMDQPILTSVC